jgi:hypothetical protein
MVTSADSKIKILDGTIVTQKYSGKLKCFTPLGLPSYLFRSITNSFQFNQDSEVAPASPWQHSLQMGSI